MRISVALILSIFVSGSWAQTTDALINEAIVQAPLEKVWDSWTTSEGLKSWLAPHAEIDFRIGGKMRTNYNADGALDDPGTIENTVLAFDPNRMIAIRVSKAPDDFPFPNAIYEMWTILYFDRIAPDQTQVRVVGNGFSADEESQNMRAFFSQGNAITLQQMQDRLGAN
jgi:uncharacterized protein YndB with AHSA1/START domain